jgi:hypothetical protein
MGKAESAPQQQSALAESQLWASHIILSPLDMSEPTAEQVEQYEAYASTATSYGIAAAKLDISGENYKSWGFSFNVMSKHGIDVMEHSVAVITTGLEQVGVEIASLEFVGAHLATHKVLQAAEAARQSVGLSRPVRVNEEAFRASDSLRLHAHNAFYGVRNRAVAVDCFDNSDQIIQQARDRRAMPRSLVSTEN